MTVRFPPSPANSSVPLSTLAPPVRARLPTSSVMLPAAPSPTVATEILPPSLIVNTGVDTVIVPAAPEPCAVLKSPLSRPEIETEPAAALTARFPPSPALVVLLSTLAPPERARLPTSSVMLPAAPSPTVATEILPPSLIVNTGVDTLIVPAGPTASAVLKSPLLVLGFNGKTGSLDRPEIIDGPVALTVKLPPGPVAPPALLVTI